MLNNTGLIPLLQLAEFQDAVGHSLDKFSGAEAAKPSPTPLFLIYYSDFQSPES
jgi:hypothetical protein